MCKKHTAQLVLVENSRGTGGMHTTCMRGWERWGKEPLNLQVWGWLRIPITAAQRSSPFWAPCGGQKNVPKDVCMPSPCGGQNNIPNDILNPRTHKEVVFRHRRLTAVMSDRIPRWRLGRGPPAPGGRSSQNYTGDCMNC